MWSWNFDEIQHLEGAFEDDLSESLSVHLPEGALCYCLPIIVIVIFDKVFGIKSVANSSKNLYSGRSWLVVE